MNFDIKRAVLASLVALLAGCDSKKHAGKPAPAPEVVAWVGDEAITREELLGALRQRGVGEPGAEATEEMLAQLVEARRLFLAGKEKGWDNDEEAAAAAKRYVARRVQRDLESRFDAIPPPTQDEIRAYYEQHASEFQTPQAALGAILYRREDPEQASRFLTQLLTDSTLPGDGSFGDLAAANSHDAATRSKGGRMLWVSPSQASTNRWPQAVLDALFALTETGQLSPVIRLADGAFVVRLIEKRPPEPIPFERVAADISTRIVEQRKAAIRREFLAELERKFPARRAG